MYTARRVAIERVRSRYRQSDGDHFNEQSCQTTKLVMAGFFDTPHNATFRECTKPHDCYVLMLGTPSRIALLTPRMFC